MDIIITISIYLNYFLSIYMSPYKLHKIKDENFYRVVNKDTGKILAKQTTDKNGKKMIKLLNYIDAKKYKKK